MSAIAADLGTITAGTVTGATIRTAASPARRVELDSNGIRAYDTGSVEKLNFSTTTGSLTLTGALTAGAGSTLPITYLASGTLVTGTVFRIDSIS